jgi:major membrane immunogen (membrane-anchored lipoprotein)
VNKTIERISSLRTVAVFVLTLVLAASAALAQDTVSGKYEGMLKNTGGADEKVSLELKNDGGKISGRMMKGETTFEIAEGSLTESKLSLKLKDGMINAVVAGDKITGDWASGNKKGTLDLKKVAPPAMPATSTEAAPATAVNLNGNWDAVADAQGQAFPFLLVLKIEGEAVTGSSSSQLGESTIKNGSWKDGKLAFDLEGQNGTISMSATVVEGKLTGQFDYAGQLQGRWVAVKKN